MQKILASLFVCLLFSGSMPAFAEPEGVDTYKVGNLEIKSILDAEINMEASLLPNLPHSPEFEGLMDHEPLPAVDKTYLLKTGEHTVLFDAGWGDEQKIKGQTIARLRELGIKPEDVTDIVLTHMDADHIGGLTRNGKAVFPNATLWISRPEYDGWIKETPKKRSEDAIKRARNVAEIYKDRLKTFSFGDTILPGISAVDASGHTPGHTAFDIASDNGKMTIGGDLIHIAQVQFARPDMSTVYDIDMEKAAATRKRLLQKAVDENSLLGGMHFYMVSPVRAGENGAFLIRQPR